MKTKEQRESELYSSGLVDSIKSLFANKDVDISEEYYVLMADYIDSLDEVKDSMILDSKEIAKRLPEEENLLGSEMEAFALFATAKKLEKKAACLLTVADSNYKSSEGLTVEDRQTALDKMIELALESAIK